MTSIATSTLPIWITVKLHKINSMIKLCLGKKNQSISTNQDQPMRANGEEVLEMEKEYNAGLMELATVANG